MTEEPIFYRVAELARLLNRHIVVFDLETTAFRGRPNFGITEVWCFVVTPAGPGMSFGGLVNPENAIDPQVVKLNGITQAMVRGQEHWGERYAPTFKKFAAGECWVTGFNNATFDNGAVKHQNARYGHSFEAFARTFDVRQLHLKLSGAKTQAGSLEHVAGLYGVKARGGLHRAQADTVLTLELLHAVIETYGVDAVVNLIEKKPQGSVNQLSSQAIAQYVKGKTVLTVRELAEAFKKDERTVSFDLSKAIDERLLDPGVFASQPAQDWLSQALPELATELLEEGKLRPIHDALVQCTPPAGFDYVQLRIGLLNAGLSWASLKPI